MKFLGELWAGRACAGTNQQELTMCAKCGGQHKREKDKKGAGRSYPGLAGDRWSLASHGSTLVIFFCAIIRYYGDTIFGEGIFKERFPLFYR
jgi:hypothetical protein